MKIIIPLETGQIVFKFNPTDNGWTCTLNNEIMNDLKKLVSEDRYKLKTDSNISIEA